MTGAHNRRSFLGELLREASRAAEHLQSLRQSIAEPEDRFVEPPDFSQVSVPAAPAAQLATLDDLRKLCREVGREGWADPASSLARVSIRWTPGGDGASCLGGAPTVPSSFVWPSEGGVRLSLVAQLALDGLTADAVPGTGTLLFFADVRDSEPDDGGVACAVVHVSGPGEPLEEPGMLPAVAVRPSAELTLPLEPESLVTDGWELAEWTELRDRLAQMQGTELEDSSGDYHALHRLLGHADTFAEHAMLAGFEGDPSEWELLFQLSGDDALGVSFGSFARLFFWIRADDLGEGRFERVRASVG